MKNEKNTHVRFLVDIESEWGVRTPHSGRMTEFAAVEYETGKSFHGVLWETQQDPVDTYKFYVIEGTGRNMNQVMQEFSSWIDSFGGDRNELISDNPAFDFMWIADAFDRAGMNNPFGHSARRIGDFAAGLDNNWKHQSQWKRLRKTSHDHNPVNDAMGNREALMKLIKRAENR